MPGARNRLTEAAARHFQPERLSQHHGGLAIGQSQAPVQLRGQRHRARPDLRGGSTAGIRGLAGMAALHRPPALLAATEVHAKTNVLHARLWDLHLILADDSVLDDPASAVRALRRQLRFQGLVDRRRNRTTPSAPGAGTFLTSWLLRILFRGSPGVRRGLPFRGPQRFFQRPAQPPDLLLQLFDFVFPAGYLLASVSCGTFQHVRPHPAGKDTRARGSIRRNKCRETNAKLLDKRTGIWLHMPMRAGQQLRGCFDPGVWVSTVFGFGGILERNAVSEVG